MLNKQFGRKGAHSFLPGRGLIHSFWEGGSFIPSGKGAHSFLLGRGLIHSFQEGGSFLSSGKGAHSFLPNHLWSHQ